MYHFCKQSNIIRQTLIHTKYSLNHLFAVEREFPLVTLACTSNEIYPCAQWSKVVLFWWEMIASCLNIKN